MDRLGLIVRAVLALLAALTGAAILLLAIAAWFDPTANLVTVIGALVWSTVGPHLVGLALVGALASLAALLHRPRPLGGIALALCSAAALASGAIVASILGAAAAAGGSVSLWQALALGPMTEPDPDRVEVMETLDGRALEVAWFLPPASAGTPAPLLVYVHGGGFMQGSKTETAADLRWFADRGFVVASIDYRLFTPGNPTWEQAPRDVACGLAWVAANADRFGADPSRLALLGDSAGGNLAINVGYATASGSAGWTCPTPVPVPSRIAVQYPAVDPDITYREGFPVPGFEPTMLVQGYIGGTPEQYPERMRAIASASYIAPEAPPTLILAPEKDSLVVPEGVYRFAEAAAAAGIDIELVRIPFANHIFNQLAANSIGNQASRTIRLRYLEPLLR